MYTLCIVISEVCLALPMIANMKYTVEEDNYFNDM